MAKAVAAAELLALCLPLARAALEFHEAHDALDDAMAINRATSAMISRAEEACDGLGDAVRTLTPDQRAQLRGT